MEKLLTLMSDLCVVIFDLILYTQMTTLRGNKERNRKILFVGCVVIVAFYSVAVYALSWTVAIAAFVCMTIPSLALFWILCKYRDARFFLTFCFVDTVSLIIGFIARYIGILVGNVGNVVAIAIMIVCFLLIYFKGKPYFKRYRAALDIIDSGWLQLTVSAALIYITLVFCAAYPKPLMERLENLPNYLLICIMVLSFYMVFFINIIVTKKVYEQSERIKEQQKWFRAAYIDALTEIPNRAAYIEKIHELERMEDRTEPVAIVVMDLDHFKDVNDTWGHSTGDDVLKRAANYLSECFSDENSTVFRIGGDEFAALAVGVEEDELVRKLKAIGEVNKESIPYSISSGYSFVDRSENNAVDQAFARADAMMYANKTKRFTE